MNTSNIANSATGEVASIQYLRGIAAMMVVVSHACDQHLAGIYRAARDVGWSGVDLFFVISGFVMTYTVATHTYSRREFFLRRLARIAPLYWVMTLVTALLAAALPQLFLHTRFTWGLFVASLFFVPYLNPGSGGIEPLLKLGWTLNYEMFFYLCFALLISAPPWRRSAILGMFFAAIAAGVSATQVRFAPLAFYGSPVTLEFVFGCVLGAAYLAKEQRVHPLWACLLVLLAGVALSIAGAVFNDSLNHREIWRGVPAAIVAAALIAIEKSAPFRVRWLHRLGDATYSIYLTHIFVVMGLRKLLFEVPSRYSGISMPLFVLFSVAVAAIVGVTVHEHLEVRLTALAKRFLPSPRPQMAST